MLTEPGAPLPTLPLRELGEPGGAARAGRLVTAPPRASPSTPRRSKTPARAQRTPGLLRAPAHHQDRTLASTPKCGGTRSSLSRCTQALVRSSQSLQRGMRRGTARCWVACFYNPNICLLASSSCTPVIRPRTTSATEVCCASAQCACQPSVFPETLKKQSHASSGKLPALTRRGGAVLRRGTSIVHLKTLPPPPSAN